MELQVLSIVREGIRTVLFVAAPPLLFGLSVGLIVSIFQAVTSIQEPTLAFVPKILAAMVAIMIFGGWMLAQLQAYFVFVMDRIPELLST